MFLFACGFFLLWRTVESWSPSSWQTFPILQNPQYPDNKKASSIQQQLKKKPPLVFAGEIEMLKKHLENMENTQEGFILQGGDCAEDMDVDSSYQVERIRKLITLMTQMSLIVQLGTGKPVTRIGRIAGQYAKPRSELFEKDDNQTLTFRGHLIHTKKNRIPDPTRLLKAYEHSLTTLNILRSFLLSGSLSLEKVQEWIQPVTQNHHLYFRFSNFIDWIHKITLFLKHCGTSSGIYAPEFYISHEALFLYYEEIFVKKENKTGKYYHCGSHTVWLGERTRESPAHIEFLSGIENPIGIKIGPTTNTTSLLFLLRKLNPENKKGKIMLISRMGSSKIRDTLPLLLQDINDSEQKPSYLLLCDPCHGNTYSVEGGMKTRNLKDILNEIFWFFEICHEYHVFPAGIHLELTGEPVTECIGQNVSSNDLSSNYQSLVDPRLNQYQAIETAFYLSSLIQE